MARKPATKTPRRTAAKTAKPAATAKLSLDDLKDIDHPLIRLLTVLSTNNANILQKFVAEKNEVTRLFVWSQKIEARMSKLELQIKRDAQKRSAEVVNGGALHSTKFVFSGE